MTVFRAAAGEELHGVGRVVTDLHAQRLPALFSSGLVQDVRVGPDVGEALVVLQRPHELATCGLDFFRELHVGADVRFGSPHVGDEPWAGEGAEQVHGEDQQQRGQEEHQGNEDPLSHLGAQIRQGQAPVDAASPRTQGGAARPAGLPSGFPRGLLVIQGAAVHQSIHHLDATDPAQDAAADSDDEEIHQRQGDHGCQYGGRAGSRSGVVLDDAGRQQIRGEDAEQPADDACQERHDAVLAQVEPRDRSRGESDGSHDTDLTDLVLQGSPDDETQVDQGDHHQQEAGEDQRHRDEPVAERVDQADHVERDGRAVSGKGVVRVVCRLQGAGVGSIREPVLDDDLAASPARGTEGGEVVGGDDEPGRGGQ